MIYSNFFNLKALQKAFQNPSQEGRKEQLMRIIKTYEKELNYIKDHYENDWDNGYITNDVYEWLEAVSDRLGGLSDVLAYITNCLDEFDDYDSGETDVWTNKIVTRYEISSFLRTLYFLSGLIAEPIDDIDF